MDTTVFNHVYAEGHQVEELRALIMHAACEAVPLADLLSAAWGKGYAAKEAEEAMYVARPQPHRDSLDEDGARDLLRLIGELIHAESLYIERAAKPWTWNCEQGGWCVEGDDCLIRPGEGGLIVMEAAGEYAGSVLVMPGARRVSFPEGTFR